jgi:hypothetical protein
VWPISTVPFATWAPRSGDLTAGECLNLKLVVGGFADHLSSGAAIQRVERFRQLVGIRHLISAATARSPAQ